MTPLVLCLVTRLAAAEPTPPADPPAPPPRTVLVAATVGFGSSQILLHQPEPAWLHMGLQGGGLVLAGIGGVLVERVPRDEGRVQGEVLMGLGFTSFLVSRGVEVWQASRSRP